MFRLFETFADLDSGAETIRRRRYGTIEVADGLLERVVLRPWPKLASVPEVIFLGDRFHFRRLEDRCLLYYDQPRRFPNFLAIKYIVSGRKTRLATVNRAMETLNKIARLKRSDAILCDAANRRLTDRVMARWGYVPHCPSRWHRHFIKRFYGDFGPRPGTEEHIFKRIEHFRNREGLPIDLTEQIAGISDLGSECLANGGGPISP